MSAWKMFAVVVGTAVTTAAATNMVFTVALRTDPETVTAVAELHAAVTDPTHSRYGEYLTPEELRTVAAPNQVTVQRTTDFLHQHGARCSNYGTASLRCTASIAIVEGLFSTQLEKVTGVGYKLSESSSITVPPELSEDVEFVTGIVRIPVRRLSPSRQPMKQNGGAIVVPETLHKLYNVSIKGDTSIVQAAGEFPGNWHQDTSDLHTFGIKTTGVPFNLSKIAGFPDPEKGNDPSAVSGETTLDIQYISGVGQGNTNWLWNSDGWVFDMTQHLQNATSKADLPSVMSLSYGWSESEQCGTVVNAGCRRLGLTNDEYVNRSNFELQKVGLLGITMLASSGDSGCHGRTDKTCLFNAKMHPAYPASSPWITAVGGTMFDGTSKINTNATSPICQKGQPFENLCAVGGTEIVSSTKTGSRITSGGGFSNIASRPSYQASVVDAYVKNLDLSNRIYNSEGRGYPDISALAHNYYIEINGDIGSEDGTSASSPVIAGLVGLLNSHRALRGRPNVGFLNPLLYQIYAHTNGTAFNDIVTGSNRCSESGCFCQTGFDAMKGWDASTGLGTPNFGRILEAMDALDDAREQRAKIRI